MFGHTLRVMIAREVSLGPARDAELLRRSRLRGVALDYPRRSCAQHSLPTCADRPIRPVEVVGKRHYSTRTLIFSTVPPTGAVCCSTYTYLCGRSTDALATRAGVAGKFTVAMTWPGIAVSGVIAAFNNHCPAVRDAEV